MQNVELIFYFIISKFIIHHSEFLIVSERSVLSMQRVIGKQNQLLEIH